MAGVTFSEPPDGATRISVEIGTQSRFRASVDHDPSHDSYLAWTAVYSGTANPAGSFVPSTGGSVDYYAPSSLLNPIGDGSKGHDVIIIKATDTHPDHQHGTPPDGTFTLDVCAEKPYPPCKTPEVKPTPEEPDPNAKPGDNHTDGGVMDSEIPENPQDEGNQDEHKCCQINYCNCKSEEKKCNTCGTKHGENKLCKETGQAFDSIIRTRPQGSMTVISGWVPLLSRGHTLDLGVYQSSLPDALGPTSLPAGSRSMFGWQVRLVEDSAGNVTIYWGKDRGCEAWDVMGGSYLPPAGTTGTLTKQGDGSFTRQTKTGLYYDFNSSGYLLQIKDRSLDGNVIYYDYSGTKVIRIHGPGFGQKPYFSYNGDRVERMTLETGVPANERRTYYRYDGSGRMIAMHQPANVITYYDYNADGNPSKKINPAGGTTYFWYTPDSRKRISRILLPGGAGIYFEYDDILQRQARTQIGSLGGVTGPTIYYDYNWLGRPLSRITSGGTGPFLETTYYVYDKNSNPILRKDPDGVLAYFVWDDNSSLVSQKNCDDAIVYFTYGPFGRITSRKNELGYVTYWNYDAQGLQTNWIDALGRTTYFQRDTYGNLTSKKNRRGYTTYYTYDLRGNHNSTKFPDGTLRYYDYNQAGEIEKLIEPDGGVHYYDHDAQGRISKWKDPLGSATQIGYDSRSNRTFEIDRRGFAWYWQYDSLSRLVAKRTALGHTTYFNYSPDNLKTSVVDPKGNATYFYYDTQKQLKATENAVKGRTYYTYDDLGQPSSAKDPGGYTTYYRYDCRRHRSTEVNAISEITYFNYDKVGNLTYLVTPDGGASRVYNQVNELIYLYDNLGNSKHFLYDTEGNQTAIEDELLRLSYFYYDSRNRVFCAEDALKGRTYYTYDLRGNRSSSKDPRGNVTYFYYDLLGRPISTRDARSGLTYLQYDAESSQVAAKSARGFATYFTYDRDRRRESVKTPLLEFTYYTYDAAANQSSVKDARNNLSYLYYDRLNRASCTEDPKTARTYFTYDLVGNRDSVKDPLSRVSYTEYDGLGRVRRASDPTNSFKVFEYRSPTSTLPRAESVSDERGYLTYTYYDKLLRVQSAHNAVDAWTYFEYDKVSNRIAVRDPLMRPTYLYYDRVNRLEAAEDALKRRTYYSYDSAGNQVSVKNARLGSETGYQYFTYDELNRRSSFKTETNNVWYYDYDASSNLQVQRNPLAALTYWQYDSLERKASQKDPLARTWYWHYDAVGNVSLLKDAKVQLTYYTYDAANLQERVHYPSSVRHYYEYDLARQRTATADPSGRTTFGYDLAGRMTVRGNPSSQNLYYVYDKAGNRTQLKDPDGSTAYYDFDGANRMTAVRPLGTTAGYGLQPYGTSAYGGGGTAHSAYEFDKANQLVHERRANGAISYYGYDTAGRQAAIQHRKSDGTLIESWAYTRDEVGNLTKSVRGTDSMNTYWNYDQASRVTREAWRSNAGVDIYGFDYTYDPAGNRSQRRRTIGTPSSTYWDYDAADQMLRQKQDATTTVYFTYDANGNLGVEHDVNASAGRTYYEYEPRNLLSKVDFPGATATNYFYYNALGERIRKDDSTGGKKYTWDGLDVVTEKNLSNTTTQRLVKGYTIIPGIGAYAMQDVGGTLIYPHKNQVGTTMRHTDAAQSIANTYEYDAWGVPIVVTQATAQQFRFTGKELDPDSIAFNSQNHRYHFPARFYLANRGVFGQVDPYSRETYQLAPGVFSYVNGNPGVSADPDGRFRIPAAGPVPTPQLTQPSCENCFAMQGVWFGLEYSEKGARPPYRSNWDAWKKHALLDAFLRGGKWCREGCREHGGANYMLPCDAGIYVACRYGSYYHPPSVTPLGADGKPTPWVSRWGYSPGMTEESRFVGISCVATVWMKCWCGNADGGITLSDFPTGLKVVGLLKVFGPMIYEDYFKPSMMDGHNVPPSSDEYSQGVVQEHVANQPHPGP